MDVLRALSSPNMDIRKKTLDIALDLITARNIDEVTDSLQCSLAWLTDRAQLNCPLVSPIPHSLAIWLFHVPKLSYNKNVKRRVRKHLSLCKIIEGVKDTAIKHRPFLLLPQVL